MLRLFRLIKGYIFFCAEGGFSERFINLCRINGISLWNVENDGVNVKAFTVLSELQGLEEAAKNSGMELKIIEKKGLKLFVNQHKWRFGVLIGLVILTAFFTYMTGFIWEVEIVGNTSVNVETFTEELAEYGVKVGVRRDSIDIREVEKRLDDDYPEFAWISLNISGGKVQLQLRDAEFEKTEIDHSKPFNIVAKKNGTVTLVKGYYGENVVKAGDSVGKGTLLISGIKTYSDGSENFFQAKGEVYARTHSVIEKSCGLTGQNKITSSGESRYVFGIFGLTIPLGRKTEGGWLSDTTLPLKSGDTQLPVSIGREDNFSVKSENTGYTENEAVLFALLECVQEKRESFGEAELERVVYTKKAQASNSRVLCTIDCVEDIAVEQSFFVEGRQENSAEN